MRSRARVAWFSPMPPIRSGVATCSSDLLPLLRQTFDIDVFVDAWRTPPPSAARSAHDFIWLNQQKPYDLTVYQLGNSSVHDYMWPYVFRFPGLVALHDAHLHHARAAALLRADRKADYRAEFAANHPEAAPDLAELAVAGFDSHLYYHWPMTRLVVERSRMIAVHSEPIARYLRAQSPEAAIETVRLGHGARLTDEAATEARRQVRVRHRIPHEAIVFGCFGGLSPEKRLPQVLAACATIQTDPPAYLLLAGAVPRHYDLHRDIERFGLAQRTIVTGYLDSDDDLTAHIAASDVALNLRWPTAREVSGPWLRCLAAGRPTVIVDLAHTADVPALDPRNWASRTAFPGSPIDERPVCVAIDILDEDHSLRLAMRRLATDAALRTTLGAAARAYWQAHHTVELMADDYRRLIDEACTRPVPQPALPPHLHEDGTRTLAGVLKAFGVANPLR